jgi:predicted ATP-grasp superfamily ATP-dependent carboligase
MKDKVIILGNDHTNSLGVVQSLGSVGYYTIIFVWGSKSGLIKSSKYTKEVYGCKDVQACIDLMIEKFGNNSTKLPVIACCDNAALALEKNNKRLKETFLYEYSTKYTLNQLAKKETQVQLAKEAGLYVPKTWNLKDNKEIPSDVFFPCLIKPLVSCQGAKSDIRICRSHEELQKNLNTLKYTKDVLLQQYIERDYEISILGGGLKKDEAIIPCVENKLTLYPKNVGLECLANIQPLKDKAIIKGIKNLINSIGYVGVFSVEMMHCKKDNKFYFTEINLRNDGANSFITKYGVNLLQNHIEDLLDKPITKFTKFNPGYYIWEMHHFLSLMHREISFFQWLSEIKKSQGFLTTYTNDRIPFFKQFSNWILYKLHLKKYEIYE